MGQRDLIRNHFTGAAQEAIGEACLLARRRRDHFVTPTHFLHAVMTHSSDAAQVLATELITPDRVGNKLPSSADRFNTEIKVQKPRLTPSARELLSKALLRAMKSSGEAAGIKDLLIELTRARGGAVRKMFNTDEIDLVALRGRIKAMDE